MRVSARLTPLVVVCLVAFGPLTALGAELFEGMDEYVRQALATWQVPGLAIAVVKDGEIVLARGYGVCSVESRQPATAETVFPTASCAKTFTAASIALLVDEGKLRWDDPVKKHVSDFELSSPWLTEHLTLRDLLTHRTGLQRCDMLGEGADFDNALILRRLKLVPAVAEPRTTHNYSNWMFTVLDEVASRVSGEPVESRMSDRIFRPLRMTATTFRAADVPRERLAVRHWRSDSGIAARPPDRGLHSTVGDLARWLKVQLAEGRLDGRQVLKAETVREMHALQSSIPIRRAPAANVWAANFYGTGLGWFVQDYRGRKLVSHGGAWGAMLRRPGLWTLSALIDAPGRGC